ncbi:MAG: hypothetical protein IT290_02885 [Deltaproteobacteria bacterium]|nr:hypothetical protein [Deltaproteobacteria bacterium]
MATSLDKLVDSFIESIPDQVDREQVREAAKGAERVALPASLTQEGGKPESEEQLYKIINDLSIPQKIKLALFGNMSARGLLIRESKNRQIPLFVLQNSRLTDNEIQEFSRNTNLSDQVLREIASNSDWMKNYAVRFNIVSNPKSPIDSSLKWVKYLNMQDLRKLMKSKNIPQVVASQCRKLVDSK